MLDGPEVIEPEKRSQLYTEGMSALIVPEHLRPRVAEHQPTGLLEPQPLLELQPNTAPPPISRNDRPGAFALGNVIGCRAPGRLWAARE